ncbi:MAG: triose-phosphate isomerase [Pseudomonadota bacterium]
MTPGIKPLVCGNWKMNGHQADKAKLSEINHGYSPDLEAVVDLAICPSFTLIAGFAAGSAKVALGAQDCHVAESGAHTGDVSAAMLVDAGARFVIVGHSERRSDHGEGDALIRQKTEAVVAAGATPIVCVGETQNERESGNAISVVEGQVAASLPDDVPADLVIAYEPVWAIGTGLVPSAQDVAEMHAAMRAALTDRFGTLGDGFRLLYGGSVKPGNATELMAVANVDGALVGGASLKPDDFLGIAKAYLEISGS